MEKLYSEIKTLELEKCYLKNEMNALLNKIEDLEREKTFQENERKKYKNFKLFDTRSTINDSKAKFMQALENQRASYHNIIEYVNVAGMKITDLLGLYDKIVFENEKLDFGVNEVINVVLNISNLFKSLTDYVLNNIPKNIMNLRETTRTTSFTMIHRIEKKAMLSFIKSENEDDPTWKTKIDDTNISDDTKEEIKKKIVMILKKSKNIPLSRRLSWQKKFTHDNLTIEKGRRRYVFSKTIDKKKQMLKIKFELVPDFSSHKILCNQWENYLKEKKIVERTCWDDHDILKNKNEKLFGIY